MKLWAGALAGLVVLAAFVALSVEGSSDRLDEARAFLEKTGYQPWYKRCVLEQIEQRLPADVDDGVERVAFLEAVRACEVRRPELIDPGATPAELAPIRRQYAVNLRLIWAREGGTARQQRCVESSIERMSDREIVALGNEPKRKKVAMVGAVFRRCS